MGKVAWENHDIVRYRCLVGRCWPSCPARIQRPAHSTSDSLDVELGPVPVEVEGVPGLFGLEMDPEAKLSNLLPKVGEAVNNMGGNMGDSAGLA